MMNKLNPRYDLPSQSYFSRVAIPSLYCETREMLEEKLRSVQVEYFSGTTDLWSSETMDPDLSYMIHDIDSTTWELLSACLQVDYMPEDHTGVNLKEALAQTLTELGSDTSKQVD